MSGRGFARYASACLGSYPPGQRNLSPNTIASYRDAFKLLVAFFADERGIPAERLSMGDLDKDAVEGFLSWPESRGRSASTVNQRLSAVRAFVGYVMPDDPARLLQYQRVLSIRQRGHAARPFAVPGREAVAAILAHPDPGAERGRRDMTPLTVLYDTGARVGELCGLRVRDVRLDAPLFPNPRGAFLTRAGVAGILSRHADGAREEGAPVPEGITPHSLRHQKAVDLLELGVNLVYIRDFLGHKSVATTEIYATVSVERKRAMLEAAAPAPAGEYPDWSVDGELMAWLNGLCK